MNLAENLKRIRKENNLSQEQLADKLGVSRQSVSKWESALAYPEMDKVLQICKMFDLNIDELLNQNLKQVEENKQSKSNINKIVDDFLDYITKTIDLITSMKLKDKIKCFIEQAIIIGIITIVLLILGVIVKNVVSSLISFLPDNIYYMVYNILINGLYLLLCLIFGTSIFLHIFKVRYLDYFVIVKEDKKELFEETNIEEEKDTKSKKKFFTKNQTEKVIIREPKHSYHNFISTMIKLLLKIFKIFVIILALCFCLTLIGLFDALTLVFLFKNSGLIFIGTLLLIIAIIIINIDVLIILYNFIINKKNKKTLLALTFLASLVTIGISTGLCLIGIKEFDYKSILQTDKYEVTSFDYDMTDDIFFFYPEEDDYIEKNINNIIVEIKHSKNSKVYTYEYDDGQVELYVNYNDFHIFKLINDIIDDINNKEIIYYDEFDIKVYASKENIEKLKQNKENYIESSNQNFYNELDNLRKENALLSGQVYSLQNEIEDLKNKILDFEMQEE